MLAGRIKLRSFLAIMVGIACAAVFLLIKACKSSEPPPKPQEVLAKKPPEPTPTPDLTRVEPTPQPASNEMAARAYDAEVIAWSKKSISGDKVKDASKGKPYKINLYKDAGKQTVNRAKVDINRNDKFDEKYTFEEGKITLQVAPADDEKYTQTYHWTGTAWAPEGATPDQGSAAKPATDTATKPAPPEPPANDLKGDLHVRAWDQEVLAWKDKTIASDKEKDVSKGMAYKINVYKDAGKTTVNRAKVDLNRNDKFDEKYTFEPGKITLQRAPADDEQYTETYHWNGNGWTKK
jgi:hypothetical protein